MKSNEFFTVSEVADLLKVERRTVIRWICAGRLKAFKPGGGRFWRVHQRDLKKFIK
jgi:excisionase family DNA binding protein